MGRTRFRALAAGLLLGAIALTVWIIATRDGMGDYHILGRAGEDNAGPPLMALIHGHLTALPRLQTVMGPVSLVWRLPFVAIAIALGAGPHLAYEVGSFACLLPIPALVGWIAFRTPTGRQLVVAATAGLLMILAPPAASTVVSGHPEEVLTTGLAIAAVLSAQADRRTLAPVLLGLAIGSKEWALLATPAVLLALPGSRARAAAIALGVTVLTCAPLPLLDPSAFHRADAEIGPITGVTQLTVWWVSSPATDAGHRLPHGINRMEAAGAVILVVIVLVTLAGWVLRRLDARDGNRGAPPIDAMALLALILLVRCLADPADDPYYLVAATLPLGVWEAGSLRRLPIVTVLAWAIQALCFTAASPFGVRQAALHGPTAVLTFLAAGILLGVYLTARTFRPRRASRAASAREPATATGMRLSAA